MGTYGDNCRLPSLIRRAECQFHNDISSSAFMSYLITLFIKTPFFTTFNAKGTQISCTLFQINVMFQYLYLLFLTNDFAQH